MVLGLIQTTLIHAKIAMYTGLAGIYEYNTCSIGFQRETSERSVRFVCSVKTSGQLLKNWNSSFSILRPWILLLWDYGLWDWEFDSFNYICTCFSIKLSSRDLLLVMKLQHSSNIKCAVNALLHHCVIWFHIIIWRLAFRGYGCFDMWLLQGLAASPQHTINALTYFKYTMYYINVMLTTMQ